MSCQKFGDTKGLSILYQIVNFAKNARKSCEKLTKMYENVLYARKMREKYAKIKQKLKCAKIVRKTLKNAQNLLSARKMHLLSYMKYS
jgi:hypothetical protein